MPAATESNGHCYQTFPELLLDNLKLNADQPVLKFVNHSNTTLSRVSDSEKCVTVTGKHFQKLLYGQAAYLLDKVKHVQINQQASQSTSQSTSQPNNQPVNHSSNQKFVAVLSASGMEYLLGVISLSLIDCVPVLLSTRNTQSINQHLIEQSGCCAILYSKEYEKQAQEISQSSQPIVLIEMLTTEQAWKLEASESQKKSIDQIIQQTVKEVKSSESGEQPTSKWALCLHTSGTTGLYPRLVPLNHRWLLEIWRGENSLRRLEHEMIDQLAKSQNQPNQHPAKDQNDTVTRFALSPLFHAAGVIGSCAAMMLGECLAIYTGEKWPLTAVDILDELDSVKATALETVPFLLEQVVEWLHSREDGSQSSSASSASDGSALRSAESGWKLLSQLDRVNYGGAACPPAVARALTDHGVNVVGYYGSTECGLVSRGYQCRELNKGRWADMRILPNVKYKFIDRPDLADDASREMVIFKNSPNRSLSQSNTPEGDWRTGDLFQQNPNDPYLFTVTGRIDDLIVHVTGEKTSPGPIEQRVMAGAEHMIERACVVGNKRFCNCLLVELKQAARQSMNDQSINKVVWDVLQSVNATIPRHSVIPERMIGILPEGSKIPVSDKGSIKRKLVDQRFGEFIESLYSRFGDVEQSKVVLTDWKSEAEIAEWLKKEAGEILGESKIDTGTSLFSQGLDSLTVVLLQKTIAEHFSTVKNLPDNLVYQVTSIRDLSKYLFNAFSSHEFHLQTDWLNVSEQMFQKYASRDLIKSCSADLEHVIRTHADAVDVQSEEARASPTHKRVYLVTGSTGSLGNFILDQLLNNNSTSKVYCAVRGKVNESSDTTFNKLAHAWSDRGFPVEPLMKAHAEQRLVTFPCQLDDPSYKLGASDQLYSKLATTVTHIIHGAWKMDFNSMITAFEESCIRPSFALLLMSGLAKRKHFIFISSISSCLSYPGGDSGLPADVPEQIHDHPQWAHSMGYGQSKLCVERLTREFYQMGMCSSAEVIRVGQIMGDTVHGRWNTAEHIPLLIKAGQLMHKMPAHYFGDLIDWVPVNCIAQAVCELIDAPAKDQVGVSNLVNPHTITWSDFLNELRQCGMKFDIVPGDEWASELATGDVNQNPAVKLANFFAQGMGATTQSNSQSTNQSATQSATKQPVESVHPVKFSTVKTAQRSPVIKDLPPVNAKWMKTCIQAWHEHGFLDKL